MSMFHARPGRDSVREGLKGRLSESAALPLLSRRGLLVGSALAGMLASGVSAAGSAVPLSIEGSEFRVGAEVNTQVVSRGAQKQVEVGTTADGVPVRITRLSYRKVPLAIDEGDDEIMSAEQEPAGLDAAANAADGVHADEVIGETSVSTKTLSSEGEVVPFLMHAVTPRTVSIAWGSDASVVYNVFREGQLLAQVSGGQYVDETVSPGTEYRYTIEAVTASTEAPDAPALSSEIHVRTLDEEGEAGDATAGSSLATKAVRAGGPTATLYKRRTFIQQDWVNVNAFEGLGCGVWPGARARFKGDDRDWSNNFDLDRNRSRTEVFLSVGWNRNPVRISRRIHVSSTTRSVNGEESVKTARPNRGWYVDGAVDKDGAYALVTLNHRIGNPFCGVGAIRYKENVHMWNDGSLVVEGYRRKVPRHEALMMLEYAGGRGTRGPWNLIREENAGFHCLLLGACSLGNYKGSHGR